MRRWVHLGFGACALLVVPLGRTGCVIVAGAAFLTNAWLAPRFGWDRAYRRPGEPRFGGLATYALAVLLLVLVAPPRVAAGAWVVLAVADPVAAWAGSAVRTPRVPWNPRKSLAGTAVAVSCATAACGLLLLALGVRPAWPPAVAAACAGALAETVPWPLDDNLPVALAAAAALGWMLA